MHREEKIKIKKSKKRVRTAFLFLTLLTALTVLGFCVRLYQKNGASFFQREKIIRPITVKSPEQELAEEFERADLKIISLNLKGEEKLEASISGGIKVIFKTEKIKEQVSSLQAILTRFKIEGRIPKKIDLRFEKPIVVF